MSTASARDSVGWSFGPFLILIGSLALFFSGRIEHGGLGDNHDPGPRAFPLGLGALLVLGGCAQGARWFWRRRRDGSGSAETVSASRDSEPEEEKPVPTSRIDVILLLGALLVYLPAMAWLGFSLCTLIFATGLMRRLGTGWRMALGMSLILIIMIQLLFVRLFKVQLPTGPWGLPL